MRSHRLFRAALAIAAAISPALAWAGGPWGNAGWGPGPYGAYGPGWGDTSSSRDPREGKVSVDRFLAPNAGALLGQAHIAVTAAPGGIDDTRAGAAFAAAVVDQLAKAGYDTLNPDPQGGLVSEVAMGRAIVEPEEQRRSPVSGEMAAGVSNRGSMMGLAINVDLSKPRKALVDTRLEVTIRDRASGKPLWEGRADIITREGDSHWSDTAIAGRLAGALFAHFAGPKPAG